MTIYREGPLTGAVISLSIWLSATLFADRSQVVTTSVSYVRNQA